MLLVKNNSRADLRSLIFGFCTQSDRRSYLGRPYTCNRNQRSKIKDQRPNPMSIISEVIESTRAIIQGMSVTLSYLPKRKQTVQYPEEPVTMQPRYRGQHLLHVDELGKEKCVACFLCAAACPSECIYIEAVDDPRSPAERVGVDERYAKVYNIDYGRCIFCGYCVEAFPKH